MESPVYSNEHLGQKLRQAGLRPSSARIHVLRYLEKHRNHPTADRIYKALRPDLPSLSRASVYNSLSALERTGLIRPLTMNGDELRYDASVEDHGHFCCEACGAICDFDLAPAEAPFRLEGFLAKRRDVLVFGLCPRCAAEKDF
ncbi:MAG: transcriptional repressor [Clostridiales Family XIII bacterium]|jgi:Fur family peroxide stress response transcriptional regulator|nr:transcriptional repressor [Clostridiales Family XIII bacterium]